jgi:hypothetical protein
MDSSILSELIMNSLLIIAMLHVGVTAFIQQQHPDMSKLQCSRLQVKVQKYTSTSIARIRLLALASAADRQ